VPVILGSRSTCLNGGFGGVDGRALRAGDRLSLGPAGKKPAERGAPDAWPAAPVTPRRRDDGATVLRVLEGPAGAGRLQAAEWQVSGASDRMGVRLEWPSDTASPPASPIAGLPSHGVVPGTIQLPPDGRPILLGVDHQTTGGYRIAGGVITADLAVLGQLAPGDRVRLEIVDSTTAGRLLREQRTAWVAALTTLRGDAGWDELWRSAGA
jgi:allophanate hydrolase subunit 2